jgi:hypothetical protein
MCNTVNGAAFSRRMLEDSTGKLFFEVNSSAEVRAKVSRFLWSLDREKKDSPEIGPG